MEHDLTRVCRDCERPFTISADEQRFLRELAARDGRTYYPPRRCTFCRAARRRARFNVPTDPTAGDEWIECLDCGVAFVFGGRDREFWSRQGWDVPKRCRSCRRMRASVTAASRSR